jgi:hypothetical protein
MASDDTGTARAWNARPGTFLRRNAVKFVASIVITCGIVYTVHKGGLKFLPEGGDFQRVRWWTLPIYVALLGTMTYFRAVRWRFLLRSIAAVPRKRLLIISSIGFAAILVLPFRIGEIVRPYMLRTPPSARGAGSRPNVRPITLTAATSSVVAERIIDGLYLSVVLAVALFSVPHIEPLPDKVVGIPVTVEHVRMSGYIMFAAFAVLFATIIVFYFARTWAHNATLVVLGKVSRRAAERLAETFEKFAEGLHVFGRGKDAFGFFVETTLYWGLNAFGMWVLAWGCGVTHADGSSASFGESCALMGMLGCAILIPGPPGLLGVFQAGIYAAMTMYYPTSVVVGVGSAYVFLLYALQVAFTLTIGGLGVLLDHGWVRALQAVPTDSPSSA